VAEEFRIKIVIKLAVTILVLLNSCSWNLQFLEYPTLLDTQNQPVEHLNAVFQGRDTCMLPCFADLTAGLSPYSDVMDVLSELNMIEGELIFDTTYYNYNYVIDNLGSVFVSYRIEDDTLHNSDINFINPELWLNSEIISISYVFSELGTPSSIFFLFFGPPAGYSIVLNYAAQGLLLRYTFDLGLDFNLDESIPICSAQSSRVDLIGLHLWQTNSEHQVPVNEIIPDINDVRETRPWWQLNRILPLSNEAFVQEFINFDRECVNIISFTALRDLGYTF